MSILFLGDFYYGYDHIKDDIREISRFIKENGYTVVLNLEGPITDSNEYIKKRGEHLRQSHCTIEVLKMLNVVGVSLANNHIMDFGGKGLKDTIEILDQNGIQHSGAGLSIEDACIPIVCFDQGRKYTIYCMTDSYEEGIIATKNDAGCAPIEVNFRKAGEGDKDGTVIAFLHTGFEYNTLPMPRNIKESQNLIDNGFRYVICSHPHLVQPMMEYKTGEIYFSLGNFYFSEFRQEFSEKDLRGKERGGCNIGYGIFIGNAKRSVSFEYCAGKDETLLNTDNCIQQLNAQSIAGFRYIIKCWKNRNNHNPILIGFRSIDNLMLKILDLLYLAYGIFRRCIRCWKRSD